MNQLEDRVRRGLRAREIGVDTDEFLREVHRGVHRRRTTAVVAAATVGVLAACGVAVGIATHSGQSTDRPPATQSPRPTPLPDGAASGVIDVQAVSAELVFRLTTNVGCVSCSTIWRQQPNGSWTRLHDFEGRNAYGGKVDPYFGPVTNFAMAPDGLQGWAWGAKLFSTHDGGVTWTQIAYGPGGPSEFGHQVEVGAEYAWSLHRSAEFGTELWRTPYGSLEDWATAQAPDLAGTTGMFTVGDSVVLETADEGLSGPRLRISKDGTTWSRLDLPCPGEIRARPAVSEVFILCTDPNDPKDNTVYRTRDLSRWERFGSWTGVANTFVPLADDRLLIGSGSTAHLLTRSGATFFERGPTLGADIYEWSVVGNLAFLVGNDGTDPGRLLRSTDGGRTWTVLD